MSFSARMGAFSSASRDKIAVGKTTSASAPFRLGSTAIGTSVCFAVEGGSTVRGTRPRAAQVTPVEPPQSQGSSALQPCDDRMESVSEKKPDLLPLVAKGESGAIEECLDRYGNLVWSLALRLCPTRGEAEDAVQDVFIDLWKSASRFNPKLASESTFVGMIARRRIIDRRRSTSRVEDVTVGESALENRASRELERVEASVELSLASQAINELPSDRQKVLRLSVYEGLTHEEIATTTGLPLGTVKSHVRRGLLAVRKALVGEIVQGAES